MLIVLLYKVLMIIMRQAYSYQTVV